MSRAKPKVILVDDEPHILEGLTRALRSSYEVRSATSGAQGLELLAQFPDTAIVMSDMRMPAMNGTVFLSKARRAAPQAVRLLLTGQADMDEAIDAINEGSIFRFLKKPCPPEAMRAALQDAAEQHRLIIAERELLEQTLRGAVKALCDTLALANPGVFGMATRVKRVAAGIAQRVGGTELWQIEVAAMLCQLGAMTLPPGLYERRARGAALTPAELEMIARVPQTTVQLLSPIPRLEAVRDIVLYGTTPGPMDLSAPRAAQILRVALDYDELESGGLSSRIAVEHLRARTGFYDVALVDALAAIRVDSAETVVELPVARLLEGMVLACDVVTKSGILLVARGHEVTPGLVRRLENFAASIVEEVVTVVADRSATPIRRGIAA